MDTRRHKHYRKNIRVAECACFGSALERQGPLGAYLDGTVADELSKDDTWEKIESEMVSKTVMRLLEKRKIRDKDVGLLLGGDLMNQCTSTAYGLEKFDIPYVGLYGACSTFALALITASTYIEAESTKNAIATASSHFCTAERQYRFPINYGSFPQGTSQHTVTGCGAAFLEEAREGEKGIFITDSLTGIVINRGITNASNMGAAMATSAADTILRFFSSSKTEPCEYDLILTGDLGKIGLAMVKDMIKEAGYDPRGDILYDCGMMIYDLNNQDVSCGGSGCGCSAVTFCGNVFSRMKKGEIKKMLLVGTGAMMSPQSLLQGLSIPAVAHLVSIEARF